MKLRKPCQHGRYEEHSMPDEEMTVELWKSHTPCHGGVFLPDISEALVWLHEIREDYSTDAIPESFGKHRAICDLLDALSVREPT